MPIIQRPNQCEGAGTRKTIVQSEYWQQVESGKKFED